MKINFVSFLKTGLFGDLALATHRQDVHRLIGPPEDISYGDKLWTAKIWKYGCLQLGFEGDGITLIGLYFDDGLKLPLSIEVEGAFLAKTATLGSIEALLVSNKIGYDLEQILTFDKQICLVTEGKILLCFKDSVLDSVQFSA